MFLDLRTTNDRERVILALPELSALAVDRAAFSLFAWLDPPSTVATDPAADPTVPKLRLDAALRGVVDLRNSIADRRSMAANDGEDFVLVMGDGEHTSFPSTAAFFFASDVPFSPVVVFFSASPAVESSAVSASTACCCIAV